MGIRGEESCWFPYSYIGSKIAIGKFDNKLLDSLKRSDTKKSLAYHINKSGFNAKKVFKKQIKFDVKNFKFFIEPHIEQGPILEKKKIPLGIVTGIRGSFRYRDALCKGEYLHSGATPYDYRKDTVVAVSNLVNEMNIHNHLDSKLQFDFLLNSLRSRDRFTPWLKAKKIKNIEYVKEYYGYSNEKAKAALDVLNDEQIKTIKDSLSKGGNNGK